MWLSPLTPPPLPLEQPAATPDPVQPVMIAGIAMESEDDFPVRFRLQ